MRVRLITILLGLSVGGCATVQDYRYNLAQRYRAECAYKDSNGVVSGCSRHYQDGWKQGYFDLSTGQCEEAPATPPHKYWNASYQSLEGKAVIEDWYSGWQDGATAAIQDGRPYFHPIVASPTAQVSNYGPHSFHSGADAGGMEVMPPAMPSHSNQPQVHIGAAPQRFASQSVEGDELLDAVAPPEIPANVEAEDSAYYGAPQVGNVPDSAGIDETSSESAENSEYGEYNE